jgi:DNA helicase-2/ATP-dependent DNA helicase PcrA
LSVSTAAERTPQAARFVPRNITPTEEQLAIQIATEDTILIEANAGAAKTTTLALRMAESWARGVRPAQCLALTYTDEARDALRSALGKIGVPAAVVRQFGIETFESFARSVMRELDGAPVPLRPDAEALKPAAWEAIQAVADNEEERWRDDLVIPSTGDSGTIEAFLRVDRNLKGRMLIDLDENAGPTTPERAASLGCDYTLLRVFNAYERIRRGGHADRPLFRGPFDATYDLARLILAQELPAQLDAWPAGVKMLMVDEMHDMNQAMHLILWKLLDAKRFFCGVGDVDQVIYSAAGADARFLTDELERTGTRHVKRHLLSASFRYDASLARAVSRFKRKRCTSASLHATAIATQAYDDQGETSCECLVVDEIRKWKTARRKLTGFAVLLRHPHQSVALENALLAADIAYTTHGFDSYLMRPEILLIRGLLAVAADRFTSIDDDRTRRRVVEAFAFFCNVRIAAAGQEHLTQHQLLELAVAAVADNPVILADFFRNQVLPGVDPAVARRLSAAVHLARAEAGPNLLEKVVDVLRMDLLAASVFVEEARREEVAGNLRGLAQSASRFATPADFFQSLNDAETKQRNLRASSSGVVLADVASVKGLEFDHVAMPYLRHGEFPGARGTSLEEENLFYVGITRARERLTLYAHRTHPSVFVARMTGP